MRVQCIVHSELNSWIPYEQRLQGLQRFSKQRCLTTPILPVLSGASKWSISWSCSVWVQKQQQRRATGNGCEWSVNHQGTTRLERAFHKGAWLFLLTTTIERPPSQNHIWFQGGWIHERPTCYLRRRNANPVVSSVVKGTTQLLVRGTFDTEERQLGCFQNVMCHYLDCPDSTGRAVLFCSTNQRHCLIHVFAETQGVHVIVRSHSKQNTLSLHFVARIANTGGCVARRKDGWLCWSRMTKAVMGLL